MYCDNCGKEVNETTKFCPECGKAVTNEGTGLDTSVQQHSSTVAPNEKKTLILGVVAFACTLLNFFGIPAIHILGIALGGYGISLAKSDKRIYGAYSKPGLLLSWIALGLGVFAFIYGAVYVLLNPEVVPQ